MQRLLFQLHRYLGIALGLLISAWCLSGFVMMYVRYPELSAEQSLALLEPLAADACCELPQAELLTVGGIPGLRVEMLDGRAVMRFGDSGRAAWLDLTGGGWGEPLDAARAAALAARFAAGRGITDWHPTGTILRDQWTVAGQYAAHRPLFRYRGNDPEGTEWYVSGMTGEIIQVTTRTQRAWNWVGAIPHWLYPTLLREHPRLWNQVVIWTSLLATFLTVIGIIIGVQQWGRRQQTSPYRGMALWHHMTGLGFGLLTLTWVSSGLLSMNPWGALEGRSLGEEVYRWEGDGPSLSARLLRSLGDLSQAGLPPGTVRLTALQVANETVVVAHARTGQRTLLDQDLRAMGGISPAILHTAATTLRPGIGITDEGLLHAADEYYFGHHAAREFPVYRIRYADGERFYLDALTGELVYAVDRGRRWYRWLHQGLHRLDFSPLRSRPLWDIVTALALLGVSVSVLTGTWLGLRRLRRISGRAAARP